MKTALSRIALAAFISAGIANAAPFSGKGIPADTGAVVHVDAETAANSTLVKAIKDTAEKAAAGKSSADTKKFEALKAELGITEKSVADATVALSAPAAGAKEPLMAVHVHGKFDQAKLLAIPKNHPEVKANKSGSHTYYSMADLDKAFGEKSAADTKTAAQKEQLDKALVCPVDSGTVIFASDLATLEKSLKAVDSKASYNNAEANAVFAGKPMLGVFVPESFLTAAQAASGAPSNPKEPKPKSIIATAGETAGNLAVHVGVKMDSAANAQKAFGQAQGMLGFLPMMLAQPKPNATAQDKADQQFLLSLFGALKVTNPGDTIAADFSYPAEKIAAKIREKQKDLAKMAEGAATGAPAPAGE